MREVFLLRRGGIATALVTAWLAACVTANAMAAGVMFEIAAGDARTTLKEFAAQAHVQLLFDYSAVAQLRTPELKGQYEPGAALRILLRGTGFTFKQVNDHTVAVMAPGAGAAIAPSGSAPMQSSTLDGAHNTKEGKRNSSDTFRLAQAAQGQAASAVSVGSGTTGEKPGDLEEVLVTAQKKVENILSVPVPVTVIDTNALIQSNQVSLEDYYSEVPGLNVTPADLRGAPILTIRGINSGTFTNPTVGVTVDDVPYGASTGIGGAQIGVLDFDPSDLARIEVLRGPQGTLYGASSLGGLIKFVTVDPSTDAVSGRLEAGVSTVYDGAEAGYNFRGAINLPVTDTLAIRLSGFSRQDPGYIDNVLTDQRGINEGEVYGGHFSALWRPSDDVSVKVGALFQHATASGISESDVEPGLGDLQQSDVRGTGVYDRQNAVYSVVVNAKLGVANFTAISGYNDIRIFDNPDISSLLGSLSEPLFGVDGTTAPEHNATKKISQEFRLTGSLGERLDWLLGAFYTHENNYWFVNFYAAQPFTGVTVGSWGTDDFPTSYTEYAGFADLTLHLTDSFDVQVGGRESQNRQSYTETITGLYATDLLGMPSPVVNPPVNTQDSSFTYLVTPTFKFSPDLMVYARLASGYRPGGPNPTSTVFDLPASFEPDKTNNYEVGVKGDTLDHRLTFDASAYYISWKDIQLGLIAPVSGAAYYANGSGAKSQGLELSLQAKPVRGFTAAAWVTWNEAVLTQDVPLASSVYGIAGDRLPDSSRFSANLALDEEFSLTGRMTGFVGGTLSYVGGREGIFTTTPERAYFPPYAKTDLRAGVKFDTWALNLYVNNLTDRRGVLSGGFGTDNPVAFFYIQPRIAGLSVTKTF